MTIGDLILRVLADMQSFDADLQKDAAKSGTKAGQTLGAKMSGGLKDATKGAKGSILAGLGLGAGLGAIGLASTAISKLTDVMGDSVAAALEEEASISKLDTALKANVKGWDGNRDAIEGVLQARMKLGFSDDEQRQSLALLVGATHDVAKALDIQRTAMDLARLKGISLADASQALIKVEAGSYKILKSLGIQLPKNATQTDALAAVQRLAAGQAEAYANTNEGKLLASQVKVGEAMEKLGAKLLPIVVSATEGAADAVEKLAALFTTLTTAIDDTNGTAKSNEDVLGNLSNILSDLSARGNESKTAIGALDEWVSNLGDDLLDIITVWDGYTTAVEDQAAAHAKATEATRETKKGIADLSGAATDATPPIEELGKQGQATGRKLVHAADTAAESFKDWRDRVVGYAKDIIDKAYQIIDDRAELSAVNHEQAELRKVMATGKATSDQKDRYDELNRRQVELVTDLAANGVTSGKLVSDTMQRLRERLKTATGEERKAILAAIALEKQLAAAAERAALRISTANALAKLGIGSQGLIGGNWGAVGGSAAGGPIPGGRPRWVGERGKELIFPMVDSMVIPHDQSMDLAQSGALGNTYNTTINYPDPSRAPEDFSRTLRRTAVLG